MVVDLTMQAPQTDSACAANQTNGEEFSGVRASLTHQRETVKQKIISSRPLSARLAGCRGAVERAQKRRQTAMAALELAQAAFKEADDFASKKEAELKSLEA